MPLTLRVFGSRARALAGRASFKFGPEGGSIGRAPDNDWVLPDPERYVSSHHARVTFSDGRFNLLDTSSNGTYVNGLRDALGHQGAHTLSHGDRIAIGGYEIVAELGDGHDLDLDAALATAPPPIDHSVSIPDLGAELDLSGLIPRLQPSDSVSPSASGNPQPLALQPFYRAAGLDVADTDPAEAQRVMGLAGLLLREMTTGLVAFARERRIRQDSGLDNKTGRYDLRRDPLDQAVSVDEALGLMMMGPEQRRLIPGVEAVRIAFRALDAERRLVHDAARQAATDVLVRLDPSDLEQRFGGDDDDAKAAHCWRQYRALHARLVSADGQPTTWDEDYEAALRRLSLDRS